MTIHLRVWGDLACFTRPETSVVRVSYPIITPSAARGVLEAILYKPQFRWNINRIAVKRPISFISFRRNEVKSVLSARNPGPINVEDERTQRNTLALRSAEYVIEASMALTPLAAEDRDDPTGPNTLTKYMEMFLRRATKGQCFNQPYLGCREFPAHFELAKPEDMKVPNQLNQDTDFGLMVYDIFDLDSSAAKPATVKPQLTIFHAQLSNGIVNIPRWSEVRSQQSKQA